ncbi:MAG: hypothetical protein JW990_12550 [Thermoleophilia bacterium]|nr:hypothetical protein [Thermoleophilia bacterium]
MAKVKEFAHLVKPLLVQQPPDGLYDEPRVWMESKHLEGFNAHFSYGFLKKEGTYHPTDGMIAHPFDEILLFAGSDNEKAFHYLGAEVSLELGVEREQFTFDKPTVVVIPRGTVHGAVTVGKLERPLVHYTIGLAPEYKAARVTDGLASSPSKGLQYARLVKPLDKFMSPASMRDAMKDPEMMNAVMAANPHFNPEQVGQIGPANADSLVWLYGDQVEGLEVNFTWGYYTRCGKWHRGGEAHTHPEEEILVFVGLDPDNIDVMDAELEIGMGPDHERHIFNTSTVAICPQGFPHLPLITRWVDKPYGFFVICLSGEHDSPWVEA